MEFHLDRGLHAEISISGDGYLELRQGRDNYSGGTIGSGSTITEDLEEAGWYTIRVERRLSGSFILSIDSRYPWLGHQADHTIKYKIGREQAPRPTPQPNNPVIDPATVIPNAISTGAARWNQAVLNSSPSVYFCKDDIARGNSNECRVGGRDKNEDGKSVMINVVSGGTSNYLMSTHRHPPWVSAVLGQAHCGSSYACVKPDELVTWLATKFKWLPIVGGHMQDLILVMEEPAWSFVKTGETVGGLPLGYFVRYYWTDDVNKHNVALNPMERNLAGAHYGDRPTWFYAPGVMMHEFGHTAGLTDLYNFDGHDNYLMGRGVNVISVPTRDKQYMRQIYHSHDPHR